MSTETDAIEAALEASRLELNAKVVERRALFDSLTAQQEVDETAADADVDQAFADIEAAPPGQQDGLRAVLYAQVIQGVIDADVDEVKSGRARGRANRALNGPGASASKKAQALSRPKKVTGNR